MKRIYLMLIPAFLAGTGMLCSAQQRVENTVSLGHGFQIVTIEGPTASSFESISHFGYLYYEDMRLCRDSICSVSPGGNFAAYLDDKTGSLMLFRRSDMKFFRFAAKPEKPVARFEWNEKEHYILIYLKDTADPRKFALP